MTDFLFLRQPDQETYCYFIHKKGIPSEEITLPGFTVKDAGGGGGGSLFLYIYIYEVPKASPLKMWFSTPPFGTADFGAAGPVSVTRLGETQLRSR